MNKVITKHYIGVLSMFLATFLLISISASIAPLTARAAGYDELKVRAFLLQADERGVTNADKLETYKKTNVDPNDKSTWTSFTTFDGDKLIEIDLEYDLPIIDDTSLSSETTASSVSVKSLSSPLNLSGCKSLVKVTCWTYGLDSLNVSGCTALEYLDCESNRLTSLDVSDCTALEYLSCRNNRLTKLDVSGFTKLKRLYCHLNQLTILNVTSCNALEDLSCECNNLTTLDVSDCHALFSFSCNDNNLKELNVSGLVSLANFECMDNQLTTLAVSDLAKLSEFKAHHNPLNNETLTAIKNSGSGYKTYSEDGYNYCVCSSLGKTVTIKCVGKGYVRMGVDYNVGRIWVDVRDYSGHKLKEWKDLVGLSEPNRTSVQGYSFESLDDTMTATAVFVEGYYGAWWWNNPFIDVSEDDWFYDSVAEAVNYRWMNGTSADTFSPNAPITRGMFVTALYRFAGSPTVIMNNDQFTDVNAKNYYYNAVQWATMHEIVGGVGKKLFLPDAKITRQDIAVMLLRYLNYQNPKRTIITENKTFADENDISDYAKHAVQVMNKLSIINGKGDNYIDPKGYATRAEVAIMLYCIKDLYVG